MQKDYGTGYWDIWVQGTCCSQVGQEHGGSRGTEVELHVWMVVLATKVMQQVVCRLYLGRTLDCNE